MVGEIADPSGNAARAIPDDLSACGVSCEPVCAFPRMCISAGTGRAVVATCSNSNSISLAISHGRERAFGTMDGVGGGTIRDILLNEAPPVLPTDTDTVVPVLGSAVVMSARLGSSHG